MTLGKRERILAGVLGALVLVAVLVLWGGGGAPGAPAGESLAERSRRLRQAAVQTPLVSEVVALDLASLRGRSGEFEVGRNPFRYGPAPAPPPRPEPIRPEPAPAPAPDPPPTTPAPDPDRCRPPSTAHLQFLGSFGPAGGEIAVVVDGDEIYNVREGETLAGRFLVEEIGYESLALRSVECPEEPASRLPVGGS